MCDWQYLLDRNIVSLALFSFRSIEASLSLLIINHWYIALFDGGTQKNLDILYGDFDRLLASSDCR